MEIALVIFISTYVGSFARIFWGWLSSGEAFVPRRFFSTVIATIILTAPIAAGLMNLDVTVSVSGLISLAVTAVMAGWGIDSALKQLSDMQKS